MLTNVSFFFYILIFMYVSTTLTKRQLHKAASSAELRNDGLTSIKAHTHRAKVEAKATIFFDVCHLFFDNFCLFFDRFRFRYGLA